MSVRAYDTATATALNIGSLPAGRASASRSQVAHPLSPIRVNIYTTRSRRVDGYDEEDGAMRVPVSNQTNSEETFSHSASLDNSRARLVLESV